MELDTTMGIVYIKRSPTGAMDYPKLTKEKAVEFHDALAQEHVDMECDCDGTVVCPIAKLIDYLTDVFLFYT